MSNFNSSAKIRFGAGYKLQHDVCRRKHGFFIITKNLICKINNSYFNLILKLYNSKTVKLYNYFNLILIFKLYNSYVALIYISYC